MYVLLHIFIWKLFLKLICRHLQLCGARLSEGIFVGAFLSMSSTAVVPFVSFVFSIFIQKLLLSCFISKFLFFTHMSIWPGGKVFGGTEQYKFSTWSSYNRDTYISGFTNDILYLQIEYIIVWSFCFLQLFSSYSWNFQDCVVGLLFALLPVLGGNSGLLQGIISMGKL